MFDDGSGPALFAGGSIFFAGGVQTSYMAKWDGTAWSAIDSGMNNAPLSLVVFDDGTGPALYAGGYFTSAGSGQANYVAKWDGTTWSALGSGVNSQTFALTVFNDVSLSPKTATA